MNRKSFNIALISAIVLFGLAFAVGCGDGDDDDQSHENHHNHHNHDNHGESGHALGTAETDEGYFSVKATHTPAVPTAGEGALLLEFASDELDVEGLNVAVEPWMPGHGHGSSATPTVTEEGGGVYQVDNILYTMPGLWQARITMGGDDFEDTITFEYNVQ